MDWHDQKWSSIGYWLGVVVCALWPHRTGFMTGWAICIVTTAIGG